jgi:2-polyprenyl-3-methyl-5-hydroxy-6-metoxy-1,4-benzoquinol methylase
MYGSELKYSKRLSFKGKLVYAIWGETHPGHLIRFFVNRRFMRKFTTCCKVSFLEIGSATGTSAFWLSRNQHCNVDAIELNKDLITDCNFVKNKIKRNNLQFICADASQRLFLDGKYDYILSSHVLEHICRDEAVLKNTFAYIKPGGYCLLQLPFGDPNTLTMKKDLDNGHVREGYTESNIRRKLESAGFEIILAVGSVGIVGRFSYGFAKKMMKHSLIFNLGTLFFPITLFLIFLEQVIAFMRTHDPAFPNWPVVLARKPH